MIEETVYTHFRLSSDAQFYSWNSKPTFQPKVYFWAQFHPRIIKVTILAFKFYILSLRQKFYILSLLLFMNYQSVFPSLIFSFELNFIYRPSGTMHHPTY